MKRKIITLCLLLSAFAASAQEDHNRIYFDTDESVSLVALDSLAKQLASSTQQIAIEGHTDDVGSHAYNQRLSEDRARYVYNELLKQGLPKEKMTYRGYGETKPVLVNSSDGNRQMNRRVEIVMVVEPKKVVKKEQREVEEDVEVSNPNGATISNIKSEIIYSYNTRQVQQLPDDAKPPVKGCRVHFSGLLMGGKTKIGWFSTTFEEDDFSEYVGAGSYHDASLAFPKAIASTFDGIAVGEGTHLVIYSEKNFKGEVLLDVVGPALINNSVYVQSMNGWKEEEFKPELQKLFPPEVRQWSVGNMYNWQHGSLKISCAH